MKRSEIISLYDTNYTVEVINTLTQYWKSVNTFNCIGSPKHYNTFLYLNNCDAHYTMKNGEKIIAKCGSVVYTAINSEYKLTLISTDASPCVTTLINFLLFDTDSSTFAFKNDIEVHCADNANYKTIFNKIDTYGKANLICFGKIKSIMYDLIFKLSEYYFKSRAHKFSIIERGIEYLEQNEEQALTIGEIASMCNVSEVYFRKLFKEYSGMSPIEFRTLSKVYKAKSYLLEEGLSIAEISDRLGFSEVSYFIKIFKKITGVTPNTYRKNLKSKV